MYAYRIKRKKFWEFVDTTREYYKSNHPLYNLGISETLAPVDQMNTVVSVLREMRGHGAELQVFEYNDKEFLFRVLERNYFFIDGFKANDWPIESVWYDGASNLLALQDVKNIQVSEWMDVQVERKRYYLVPIVELDDVYNFYQDKFLNVQ